MISRWSQKDLSFSILLRYPPVKVFTLKSNQKFGKKNTHKRHIFLTGDLAASPEQQGLPLDIDLLSPIDPILGDPHCECTSSTSRQCDSDGPVQHVESPKLVDAKVSPVVPQGFFQDAQSPIDSFPDTLRDAPASENLPNNSSKAVDELDKNLNSVYPASLGIRSLTIPASWESQGGSAKVSTVESAPETVYDHDSG